MLRRGSGNIKPVTVKKKKRLPQRFAFLDIFWVGILSVSFFFVNTAEANQYPVVVQVRAIVKVDGNDILLKDLAEIKAPPVLKEKMGAICIGVSPPPGKERKISGRQLISMVKSAKVMPDDTEITAPESIQIQRASQSIPEAALQELFERSFRGGLEGSEVNVRRVRVSGTNQFPTGKLSMSVTKITKQEVMGNINLRVQVQVDGQNCGRLTLSGWVDRFMPVVCVSREVKSRTVLGEHDLTLKNINISTLTGEPVTHIADAIGKQTKITLRAGSCLRSGMLTLPPLVYKGDQVKILAGSGKLSVSAMGIAKDTGSKGDQIQVENIESNKTVVGRVIGQATVEVMF